jgi:streptogramin lyase
MLESSRLARAGVRTLAILTVLACLAERGAADGVGGRLDPPDGVGGRLRSADGSAVEGALVSFQRGEPAHRVTVFSDADGRFRAPASVAPGTWQLRVRRVGWQDLRLEGVPVPGPDLDLVLERHTDPAAVAAQLPANHWFALVLERLEDETEREELKRQCTYCHQQGSRHTRLVRDEEEWRKVLALMGRMGGFVSGDLREKIPGVFNAAYAPETAVPRLTAGWQEPDFAPPPSPEARRAVIEEWELGGRASVQHDVAVHPDGRVYSVDMSQDMLYRLDPGVPGGLREAWAIPDDGLPLGGAFAGLTAPDVPTANAHVGPHSLQVAGDGSVWITLALGNRLARFDPTAQQFSIVALRHGYYPHTLRFDGRGRIWYTIAASNHLGMYDPSTGEHREMRLPAAGLGQALTLRLLPALLWLGRHVDLRRAAGEGDGVELPIPYGIDVAPDGSVYFSQLNEHRIGRVDPDSFALRMIDTPFPAPRRLRFDAQGDLWIPSFSGSRLARFSPDTGGFRQWEIPVEPRGSETPYALHVERRTGHVWICGTNSDTLLRFEPERERFTVYPLPMRVTYTREIDFDGEGRVWTSNSNGPTWQIEGGMPQVIRLDPEGPGAGLDWAGGAL